MSSAKKDWLVALGYVALIYATLEVARLPLQFLRSHNLLRFSLGVLFAMTAVGVVWVLVKNHGQNFWRMTVLGAVGLSYVLVAQTVQTPEEQIHFFEYGLVGILFFRALAHHLDKKIAIYSGAFVFATAAGWIDEYLQGLTPNRHYDLHDVFLNAVSSALGLLVFFLCKPSNSR